MTSGEETLITALTDYIKALTQALRESSDNENKAKDPENIRALHSALVSKHATLNMMLWQVPVIAFAAQAFLLTIALDDHKPLLYQIVPGIASTFIGLLSWQVFLRHSAFLDQASKDLESLENDHFGKTYHSLRHPDAWFVGQMQSRFLWKWGLFLISLVGLIPLFEHVHFW